MQVRPGKIAVHGAILTLVTRSVRRARLDSSACVTGEPPLTSLSPPPCAHLPNRVAIDVRARRPPRLVPRGPRERRALSQPEMPSIARRFAAAARTGARTDHGAFVETRRSRDEDCRLSNESSPFRLVRPRTLTRLSVSPLVARPPSTRLLSRPSFRLVRYRGRASLSPKTTYRLLQYDDARAPAAGRRILDRGMRRRAPCLRSLFASSLRGHASDEPRGGSDIRRCTLPVDRPTREKDRESFDDARPLLEATAHPSVVRACA